MRRIKEVHRGSKDWKFIRLMSTAQQNLIAKHIETGEVWWDR